MSDSNDSEDEFYFDGSGGSSQPGSFVLDAYGNPILSDKRAHHNALERKRRDHIKDSFSLLRSVIPTLRKEKASRATVLKKAAGYISFMKQRNHNHQREIDQVKAQNKVIEDKIAALERSNQEKIAELERSNRPKFASTTITLYPQPSDSCDYSRTITSRLVPSPPPSKNELPYSTVVNLTCSEREEPQPTKEKETQHAVDPNVILDGIILGNGYNYPLNPNGD